jgi:hypothetical protein
LGPAIALERILRELWIFVAVPWSSSLIGRRVEVVYRDGRLERRAAGVLRADHADFILIEQHFERKGSAPQVVSLKIPHACIVRLDESSAAG